MQWQTIDLLNQLTPAPPNLGTWIRTHRAQVIGGWLVRTVLVKREIVRASPGSTGEMEVDTSIGLTFVPDHALAWRP